MSFNKKKQVESELWFNVLPIDITERIISELSIHDIISFEHAMNTAYMRHSDEGIAMTEFPDKIPIKLLSYHEDRFIDNLYECDYFSFKILPKVYHKNTLVHIEDFSYVFDEPDANENCRTLGGLWVQLDLDYTMDESVDYILDLNMFNNLRLFKAEYIEVLNVHDLPNLEELHLYSCDVNEIHNLPKLRKLRLKCVPKVKVHDLISVDDVDFIYERNGDSYYGMIELSKNAIINMWNMPNLLTLRIINMKIVRLENIHKLKMLTIDTLITYDTFGTKESEIVSINHLKSLEKLYMSFDSGLNNRFKYKIDFHGLKLLNYIRIDKVLIDNDIYEVLNEFIKNGTKIDVM